MAIRDGLESGAVPRIEPNVPIAPLWCPCSVKWCRRRKWGSVEMGVRCGV